MRRAPRHRIGLHTALTAVIVVLLAIGVGLLVAGLDDAAHAVWALADVSVLVPLTWSIGRELRRGRVGVDVIALLAIVGALVLGEYLAGAIIALMLAGGNALEEYARGRAGRELSTLVERAPREAHVRRGDSVAELAAEEVVPGDVVVVRAGEIVPVDGVVTSDEAVVNASALTGEPLPERLHRGAGVSSGAANAGNAFEMTALRTAADSVYASIVALVEQAVARKAPMVRLADRYAVVFLVLTLVLSVAAWGVSGDPVRALAVLVVATPCPLILAPPVALVAGTSRATRAGVIVKGATAIEALGRARTVMIDKTGTITLGTPQLERIVTGDGRAERDLLRVAGALEQMSVHSLAESIAHAATERVGVLPLPSDVEEQPGHGIRGLVDGVTVAVGSSAYLRSLDIDAPDADLADGVAAAYVAVGGELAGRIELADTLRTDARELAPRLARAGITRVVMATGDHAEAARRVAAELGISEVHADCTAQRKLDLLAELQAEHRGGVVMVGDGVNDAPALAAADVGIAMGSAGATAASDAAEAVIVSARISVVADAISIGRRSMGIARQSVIAGMTMSGIGMCVAAAGHLPPVYGALLQEGIDLAVILNALRALGGSRS